MPPIPIPAADIVVDFNDGQHHHHHHQHHHDGGDNACAAVVEDDDNDQVLTSDVFGNDLEDVDVWGDEGPRPKLSRATTARKIISPTTTKKKGKKILVNEALAISEGRERGDSKRSLSLTGFLAPPPPPPPPPEASPGTSLSPQKHRHRRFSAVTLRDKIGQHQQQSPSTGSVRRFGRSLTFDGDTSHSTLLSVKSDNNRKPIVDGGIGTVLPNTPRSRMRRLKVLNNMHASSGSNMTAPELPPVEQPPKQLSVAEKRRLRNECLSSRASEVEGENQEQKQKQESATTENHENGTTDDPFLSISSRRILSIQGSTDSSNTNSTEDVDFESSPSSSVNQDDDDDNVRIKIESGQSPSPLVRSLSASSMSIDVPNNNASFSSGSMMLVSNSTITSLVQPSSLSSGEMDSRFDASMTSFGSKGAATNPPKKGRRPTKVSTESAVSVVGSLSSSDMSESVDNNQNYMSEMYQAASPVVGKPLKLEKKLSSSKENERNASSKTAAESPPRPSRASRKSVPERGGSKARGQSVPRDDKLVKQTSDVVASTDADGTRSRKSSKSKPRRRKSIGNTSQLIVLSDDVQSTAMSPKSLRRRPAKLSDTKPPRCKSSGDIPVLSGDAPEPTRRPSAVERKISKSPRSKNPRRKIKYQRASSDSNTDSVMDLLNSSKDLSIHLEF